MNSKIIKILNKIENFLASIEFNESEELYLMCVFTGIII